MILGYYSSFNLLCRSGLTTRVTSNQTKPGLAEPRKTGRLNWNEKNILQTLTYPLQNHYIHSWWSLWSPYKRLQHSSCFKNSTWKLFYSRIWKSFFAILELHNSNKATERTNNIYEATKTYLKHLGSDRALNWSHVVDYFAVKMS